MKEELYEQYLTYKNLGVKSKAKSTLNQFILSFTSFEEKEEWVWDHIEKLPTKKNGCIRYEIFNEMVFPVLLKGYKENSFRATLLMSKFIHNINQSQKAIKELGHISEEKLLEKCSELDPSNEEVRHLRLKQFINWLDFSQHEWPSGILYGMDGASIDQCHEIEQSLETIKKLDIEKQYTSYIQDYRKKLHLYMDRIQEKVTQ